MDADKLLSDKELREYAEKMYSAPPRSPCILLAGSYNENVASERRDPGRFWRTPGSESGGAGWEKVECVGVTPSTRVKKAALRSLLHAGCEGHFQGVEAAAQKIIGGSQR
jgi:hypothetical protein